MLKGVFVCACVCVWLREREREKERERERERLTIETVHWDTLCDVRVNYFCFVFIFHEINCMHNKPVLSSFLYVEPIYKEVYREHPHKLNIKNMNVNLFSASGAVKLQPCSHFNPPFTSYTGIYLCIPFKKMSKMLRLNSYSVLCHCWCERVLTFHYS